MPTLNPKNSTTNITLALSPQGHLYLDISNNAQEILPFDDAEKITTFFAASYAVGLLRLGLVNFSNPLPPSFAFWQQFSQQFIAEVCKISGLSEHDENFAPPLPTKEQSQEFITQAPFAIGIEYLNADVLTNIWQDLTAALMEELKSFAGNILNYFSAYDAKWNLVGRVCFHLAENKSDTEMPFAFLATYSTHLSTNAKIQHLPLGRALQEYAGEKNKSALLALLLPIQKAATQSSMLKRMVDENEIFQPQAWKASTAHRFLKNIPLFEAAGIVVRVPNWWNAKKPSRPQISITVGKNKVSTLGMDALLDFDMQLTLGNDEKLTAKELEKLLSATEQLVKIKGQWVEVDRDQLQQALAHWKKVQQQVNQEGLTFAEGMRLLARTPSQNADDKNLISSAIEWSSVIAGDWLREILNSLRNPEKANDKNVLAILKKYLQASLRPYQLVGVQWLWLLYNLKLGGCLADDMGLGKTIQILALLMLVKYHTSHPKKYPHLLVVPASLLGNWQAEIARFTPGLKILIAHSSANDSNELKTTTTKELMNIDLVITTYAFVHRLDLLTTTQWDLLILDEAQMIKNPNTKQTRAVKALKSKMRFTLTGTPIENRLSDLWSLFDFTAPGLMGSSTVFSDYSKNSAKKTEQDNAVFYAGIRKLVSPYILRRLKSDKSIIADLPDKTELQAFCMLSKQQVGLYQQAVDTFKKQVETVDGIQRRGLVLALLMQLKQICNHPIQWLGHGEYTDSASGKFLRLKELCEEIAAKQEKVLIFTQFREIIPALASYLATIFSREGLILHGATAIKQRAKLVEAFQQEQGPPFFVLSLKAGGTGLNLTNAAHVIHFDRWWNPAVENQATDRAYRIGQKKNVLVHKFICRGTVEEKIDALITSKKTLSNEILTGGKELLLTELSNDDLINIVSLDIHQVLAEEGK